MFVFLCHWFHCLTIYLSGIRMPKQVIGLEQLMHVFKPVS